MKINVRIGTLTVEGAKLTRAERAALGPVVESELQRLLHGRGPVPQEWGGGGRTATRLGTQVAAAVYDALPPEARHRPGAPGDVP